MKLWENFATDGYTWIYVYIFAYNLYGMLNKAVSLEKLWNIMSILVDTLHADSCFLMSFAFSFQL